jgi:SAM-dependent methyltransferase
MSDADVALDDLERVLDFGCGVGRVLRYWPQRPGLELHGTDFNGDAVAWCRDTFPKGTFKQNGLHPPLDYDDNTFDLIYALSVFTHFTEDMQLPWLRELLRILRPGKYLYFTTHGLFYRATLKPEQQVAFDADRLVVGGVEAPGSNDCAAFHPRAYVEREMLAQVGCTLVAFTPRGARGNPEQDSWLVRK